MLAGVVVVVAQLRKLMIAWVVTMMMDLCGTNSQVQFEGSKVRLGDIDVAHGAVLLLDTLAGLQTRSTAARVTKNATNKCKTRVCQVACASGFTW